MALTVQQVKEYYGKEVHLTRDEAHKIMEKRVFVAVFFKDRKDIVHMLHITVGGLLMERQL